MPWDEAVSFNEEALKSRVFSDACQNSLQVMAIVCELAGRAGFTDMDDLYETMPEVVAGYCVTARNILRVLKGLEAQGKKQ